MITWVGLATIGFICSLFVRLPLFGLISLAVVLVVGFAAGRDGAAGLGLTLTIILAVVALQVGYFVGLLGKVLLDLRTRRRHAVTENGGGDSQTPLFSPHARSEPNE
ncbi:hypothetical protein ACFQU1_10450 [Chelatococcus sp. GCM10030263]|jgi:hypothetical protein|uniref:hypothetical protein n=1 Tax=Chelatococcus sp. GCM10030263 TaxID=3273387 RepID=UPI00362102A7